MAAANEAYVYASLTLVKLNMATPSPLYTAQADGQSLKTNTRTVYSNNV